eukprot:scaffold14582_cov108-Isochrysis_galbana.AAC.16
MTDPPPIEDTEAREQDAPGTTDAKHRAPLHGHTGDVPPDKALSDTRGRSWTDLVQSPDVAAGASACKGGSLAGYSPYTTTFGTPSDPAPASLIDGAPPTFSPSPPPEHSPAASGPSDTAATTPNSSGLLALERVSAQPPGCVFAAARASVVRLSAVCEQFWRQAGARSGARLPPPGPPALAPGGTS